MGIRELVEQAVLRPLGDNDGKSGATLERAVLPDGRRVVVTRFDAESDLVMRILDDERGREVAMWENGVFSTAFPPMSAIPSSAVGTTTVLASW